LDSLSDTQQRLEVHDDALVNLSLRDVVDGVVGGDPEDLGPSWFWATVSRRRPSWSGPDRELVQSSFGAACAMW